MNEFLDTVRKTETPYGSAALWWLGQMGLLLKMGNTVLCIDYFASDMETRQVPAPIPAEEVTGIDAFQGKRNL